MLRLGSRLKHSLAYSKGNKQQELYYKIRLKIMENKFDGWTDNHKINIETAKMLQEIQKAQPNGPYVNCLIQSDGLLNGHVLWRRFAAKGIFPHNLLLQKEFSNETVYKEVLTKRAMARVKASKLSRFDNNEVQSDERYDIVIDGSNLYYNYLDLSASSLIEKAEFNRFKHKYTVEERNKILKLVPKLFEGLFTAQNVFDKIYPGSKRTLKIAVLSKDIQVMGDLKSIFDNKTEMKFNDIKVDYCLLRKNQDEDRECIALALSEKALILSNDKFLDCVNSLTTEKNKDLFRFWITHAHYDTSALMLGVFSPNMIEDAEWCLKNLEDRNKSLNGLLGIGDARKHFEIWPDFRNISQFLKNQLINPEPRVVDAAQSMVILSVACNPIKDTLKKSVLFHKHKNTFSMQKYKLNGFNCFTMLTNDEDRKPYYNSFQSADRVAKWMEFNQAGFHPFNERIKPDSPLCMVENARLSLPWTWRQEHFAKSNTSCGKGVLYVPKRMKSVIEEIEHGSIDLSGKRPELNNKHIKSAIDQKRFGVIEGEKALVKIRIDKETGKVSLTSVGQSGERGVSHREKSKDMTKSYTSNFGVTKEKKELFRSIMDGTYGKGEKELTKAQALTKQLTKSTRNYRKKSKDKDKEAALTGKNGIKKRKKELKKGSRKPLKYI